MGRSKIERNKCALCESTVKENTRKYCSTTCQSNARRTSMSLQCLNCSTSFFVHPHRVQNGLGKFCSVECRRIGSFTAEVKEKMSSARKGRSTGRGGNKCHFWKGGITPESRAQRTSLQYINWRTSVYIRDDYTCQICNVKGGILNADHIKSFASHPELRFEITNGRTLCIECHRKTDNYGGKSNKKITE